MIARVMYLLLVSIFAFMSENCAQEVQLKIQNIQTDKGVLCVAVFDSEENFKREKTLMQMRYDKTAMSNHEMLIVFQLQPGNYGISVLDDENGDDKMNWNLFGIPREGFGFADYYHTGLKKPHFQNFKFDIPFGHKKSMIVKMKYF